MTGFTRSDLLVAHLAPTRNCNLGMLIQLWLRRFTSRAEWRWRVDHTADKLANRVGTLVVRFSVDRYVVETSAAKSI